MSRTKHHRGQKHRHWGTDLWSRRGDMGQSMKNTFNKRLTIRRERGQFKSLLNIELNQNQSKDLVQLPQ